MRLFSHFAAVAAMVATVAGQGLSQDTRIRSSRDSVPLKVMIVGDSITHGHEGDYTWRYRIWEWFRANNVSVDFVGPYRGTIARDEPLPPQPPLVIGDPAPPLFGKPRIPWGYSKDVPEDFDPDHFSTGGYKALLAKEVIRDLTKKYQPDLILSLLGINDFIWSRDSPEGLLASMKTIIDEIRIVNPKAKFAVGNVIWRGFPDAELDWRTAKYNPMLEAAIPSWSTERSPIYHVDVASAYSCRPEYSHCPAGFDKLHPSTLGAYQIAQAFAQSLINNFSIGEEPLKVPVVMPVNREYLPPKNLLAEGSSIGVKVTWDHNYGMTSYMVKWRIEGQNWNEQYTPTNRLDTITEVSGIKYQYQVKSCHGDQCSTYSEMVEAVSNRNTAPPPTNLRTTSLDGAFRLEWSPPENSSDWNITMYELNFLSMAESSWNVLGSRRFSEKITGFFGLPKDSIWKIRMATWTDPEGAGLYEYARPICAGGGEPAQPQNLHARYTSHTSALLTWNASANAAGYLVYTRAARDRHNATFEVNGDVVMGLPQKQVQDLVLGRGEYEFCVTAVNGNVESAKSECVAPGVTSVGQYPVDWLRSISIYSTVWFCSLLMVAVFLAMSRRTKEPPGILEGIELAEDQKPREPSVFIRQNDVGHHGRID